MIIALYTFPHGLMTTYISLYQDSNFSKESTVAQLQTEILFIMQDCYNVCTHRTSYTSHSGYFR
jgi:hypothetical protein